MLIVAQLLKKFHALYGSRSFATVSTRACHLWAPVSTVWLLRKLLIEDPAFRYEGVSVSFRTGRLERKLQMIQLSATRCSCIAVLWVSLVSFAAIILSVASQRMFIFVSIYLVIDSVRKLLATPSYDGWIYWISSHVQPTRGMPSARVLISNSSM
jgi:hypothetical protein